MTATSTQTLLQKNRDWSARVRANDPDFFNRMAKQQTPKYLWIGCSDSRVPANQVIDMSPGEVFVHRNIANVVVHTDLNCLSVIQYAVDALHVEHILVVGHYGCGGIEASVRQKRVGLADNWLGHVNDVAAKHATFLRQLGNHDQQHDRLCELNAVEQVANVCRSSIVRDAWSRGQNLTVHGWVYSLRTGLINDLQIDIATEAALESGHRAAVERIYHRTDQAHPTQA